MKSSATKTPPPAQAAPAARPGPAAARQADRPRVDGRAVDAAIFKALAGDGAGNPRTTRTAARSAAAAARKSRRRAIRLVAAVGLMALVLAAILLVRSIGAME